MRLPKWPPAIVARRGKDYVRFRQDGSLREICLGPTGSPEAKAEYARIVAELAAHNGRLAPRTDDVSVNVVVLAFLDYAKARWGTTGHYRRMCSGLTPVVRLYGTTPARNFGPVAFGACRLKLVETGVSRQHVNAMCGAIRHCFRWAHEREMVPLSVWQALVAVDGLRKGNTPARETAPVRPVAIEDVQATLPYLPPIVADLVRFQLAIGARPAEACAVRPCDVTRPWQTVNGVALWLYKLDKHKTDWRGHKREIPLGPKAQTILAPYLEGRAPTAYCFSPREVAETFLKDKGRAVKLRRKRAPGPIYLTNSYYHAIIKACRRRRRAVVAQALADGQTIRSAAAAARAVPDWHPNQLRHTTGTAIRTARGREDAQAVLGHAAPTTTDIYAEILDRAALVAATMG